MATITLLQPGDAVTPSVAAAAGLSSPWVGSCSICGRLPARPLSHAHLSKFTDTPVFELVREYIFLDDHDDDDLDEAAAAWRRRRWAAQVSAEGVSLCSGCWQNVQEMDHYLLKASHIQERLKERLQQRERQQGRVKTELAPAAAAGDDLSSPSLTCGRCDSSFPSASALKRHQLSHQDGVSSDGHDAAWENQNFIGHQDPEAGLDGDGDNDGESHGDLGLDFEAGDDDDNDDYRRIKEAASAAEQAEPVAKKSKASSSTASSSSSPAVEVKTFPCDFCEEDVTPNPDDWARKRVKCTHCQHTITLKTQYKKERPQIYACQVCSRSFSHLTSLKLHKCYLAFHCTKCRRTFQREEGDKTPLQFRTFRRNHFKHCTGPVKKEKSRGRPPTPCPKCGKEFKFRSVMLKHYRVHEGEGEPLECGHCGKTFTRRSDMAKHENMRTCRRRRAGAGARKRDDDDAAGTGEEGGRRRGRPRRRRRQQEDDDGDGDDPPWRADGDEDEQGSASDSSAEEDGTDDDMEIEKDGGDYEEEDEEEKEEEKGKAGGDVVHSAENETATVADVEAKATADAVNNAPIIVDNQSSDAMTLASP